MRLKPGPGSAEGRDQTKGGPTLRPTTLKELWPVYVKAFQRKREVRDVHIKAVMSPNLSDDLTRQERNASEKAERRIQALVKRNSPGSEEGSWRGGSCLFPNPPLHPLELKGAERAQRPSHKEPLSKVLATEEQGGPFPWVPPPLPRRDI